MKVSLDFSDLFEELQYTAAQADLLTLFVLEKVTEHVEIHWKAQARNELFSLRKNYIQGIVRGSESRYVNSITLVGKLNNMVESGAPPFDMKIGFMRSEKVKYDQKGRRYLTIPFRWAVPTSLGDNPAFSNKMPVEIHSAIKALQKQYGSNVSLKSRNLPEGFNAPSVRQEISTPTHYFPKYTHKSPIFEGLKNVGRANHTRYMTFRRVSENSDPNSWIHPGFEPKNLAQKALSSADIDQSVDNFVDQFLQQI